MPSHLLAPHPGFVSAGPGAWARAIEPEKLASHQVEAGAGGGRWTEGLEPQLISHHPGCPLSSRGGGKGAQAAQCTEPAMGGEAEGALGWVLNLACG